jgi:hypothetical protein
VPRPPRLLQLVHLFPAKKNPMRETLRLAPLGLAEPCTGNQRREACPRTVGLIAVEKSMNPKDFRRHFPAKISA